MLVVGAATAALTVVFAASALAAPPAMTLSSFEATATDGVIDGGTRSISVTNLGSDTLVAYTVDLGEAPCDCVVDEITGGIGTIEDGVWVLGDLAPGDSAEITFTYTRDIAVTAVPPYVDLGTISMIALALVSAVAMAVFAKRYSQPDLATLV